MTVTDAHGGTLNVPVTVSVAPMTLHITFCLNYGSGSNYWTTDARNAMSAVAAWLSSNIVAAPVTLTYDVVGSARPIREHVASASTYFTSSVRGVRPRDHCADEGVDGRRREWIRDGRPDQLELRVPVGLRRQVRNNQYDFTATAMIHELLHTFGFLTGIADPSTVSS